MDTVSPQTPWSYVLQLPHDPRAPRVARTILRAVLELHGPTELRDTAELLACELVTNAYRHSGGQSTLRLRHTEDGGLRVSVWDTNPLIPAPFDRPPGALTLLSALSPAADTAEGGRGLLLVQECADNWGGYPLGDDLFGRSGKLLWFELTPKRELVSAA
ncbi:ATP-binding protein [Streptomyces finlayi]|uniref:ATP-binding protein n=1 Tax=Streptomyces finlayi TaxID=67296 RepID=A0A7G7BQ08_9ACTN|nr:ATP-binding protein [Streptomyces finlayi]QNE77423.1 ATP-binding protein [Streptomyces finlayi]